MRKSPFFCFALLLAFLFACETEQPIPSHRRYYNPSQGGETPNEPHYPDPDAPENSTPVPLPLHYVVFAYLEPDTVFAYRKDRNDGTAILHFQYPSRETGRRYLERPRKGISAEDSAAYVRQARLHGEDGKRRMLVRQVGLLLMNVTSLRAELVARDGTVTDVSDRSTLTYGSPDNYLKSGYTDSTLLRYTRRFSEMNADALSWLDPTVRMDCRFPPPAAGQTIRLRATLADGTVLTGTVADPPAASASAAATPSRSAPASIAARSTTTPRPPLAPPTATLASKPSRPRPC